MSHAIFINTIGIGHTWGRKCFYRKFIGASRHKFFLLECREDEKRQADFPSKEASLNDLETTASFTVHAILMEI